jgi:hypothetical protein
MTINLLQTQEYRDLMKEHITKSIEYLFNKNQEFAVVCEVSDISFYPELPENLKESFQDTVLLMVANYSLESATLEDDSFSFEAGFGEGNFGSTVSMPLLAIKQVLLGDNPIVLNFSKPEPAPIRGTKTSMEALLNNPKNKKLLKKKL